MHTRALRATQGAAAGLAFAVLANATLIEKRGIPGFRHDWAWPLSDSGLRYLEAVSWSAWTPYALGKPALDNFALPVWMIIAALGYLVSSEIAVRVSLIVIIGSLFAGGYALGTTRDRSIIRGLTVGVLSAGSPFIFYKLVAGHLIFLTALSATIGAVAIAVSTSPIRLLRSSLLIALGVVAFSQQQFFIFAPIAMLLAIVVNGRPAARAAAYFCSSGVISHLLFLVYTLSGTVSRHLVELHFPLARWEVAQSASLETFLTLRAAPTAYLSTLPTFLQTLTHAGGLALLTLVLGLGLRERRSLMICFVMFCAAAFGASFSSTYGLSAAHIFIALPWLAVLRELANAQVIILISLALLIATLKTSRFGMLICLFCTLLLSLPVISGGQWSLVPLYIPSHTTALRMDEVSRLAEGSRFMTLPTGNPVSISGVASGGMDPLYLNIGKSSAAYSVEPEQPLAYLQAAALRGDVPNSLARSLGIAMIFSRPELASDWRDYTEPHLLKYITPWSEKWRTIGTTILSQGGAVWAATGIDGIPGRYNAIGADEARAWCFIDECPFEANFVGISRDELLLWKDRQAAVDISTESNDPSQGWVSVFHWYFADPGMTASENLGAWTRSQKWLPLPRVAKAVFVYSRYGSDLLLKLGNGSRRRTRIAAGQWQWLKLPAQVSGIAGHGEPIAVSRIAIIGTQSKKRIPHAQRVSHLTVFELHNYLSDMSFRLSIPHPAAFLSIGQRYDNNWELSADGRVLGPPTWVASGYAAGWIVPANTQMFVAHFRPQKLLLLSQVASLIMLLAPLLAGLYIFFRRMFAHATVADP